MKKIELPLRIGVGIILLNSENKVFVGKRRDNPIDKWQMPQGGVDQNEEYLDAMKRELFEETGVKSIEIITFKFARDRPIIENKISLHFVMGILSKKLLRSSIV